MLPSSSFFQWLIWFGCTSWHLAISCSGSCSLKASRATFALNSAVNVRLFFMVALTVFVLSNLSNFTRPAQKTPRREITLAEQKKALSEGEQEMSDLKKYIEKRKATNPEFAEGFDEG